MRKKSKNRILACCIAFVFIAALIISFSLLGGVGFSKGENYSETFKGSVSKSGYGSKEAAARGFVSEELTGTTNAPRFVGFTKTADLSEDELAAINARRLIEEDIRHGEKVIIEYRSADVNNNVKAYLLETPQKYRYYVLPPEIDEPVTNAYLDSVFDGAKYLNCTSVATVSVSILEIMTTYRQIIKFSDDKAQFNQEMPGLINELFLREYNGKLTAYLEHPELKDGKFYTLSEINSYYLEKGLIYALYLKKGGEQILVDDLKSMRDVTDFAFMMNVDASYFVKTENGFSMSEDKYKAVCKAFAGKALEESLDKFRDDNKVHFRSDYYVSDGRLSRNRTVLGLLHEDNFITISAETAFSDFGTTEVIIPERY